MSIPDNEPAAAAFAAFVGDRQIAHGDLAQIVRAAHAFADAGLIVFEDATGRVFDLDLRGSADEAVARLSSPTPPPKAARGRPKLGVTAREVTLLPRHWEWLATQPGGASAVLRRLVEDARRQAGAADAARQRQEAAYRAMTVLAGNLPAYEESVRALFAEDLEQLAGRVGGWPRDIANYVMDMASGPSRSS